MICAIGNDCASVISAIKAGKCGIAKSSHLAPSCRVYPVGEVKLSDAELKQALGISNDNSISRTALLGAIAAKQAIDQAGIDVKQAQGKRVALISGTTVGGMDLTEKLYSAMLSDAEAASMLSQHDCGSCTKKIAELCGLDRCKSSTVSTACSSALNAIILGARMLLSGEADMAIVGGAEALTNFHILGFGSLKILDYGQCRPFDANRQGLNLGEGAGFLALERAEEAESRGAKPLGYIAGYGNRCDAYHATATSENGEGAFLAMTDAMQMAALQPSDIDYINAHGTGTPDNDRSESAAIKRVFGSAIPSVSSTKSLTGHTTSASGGIEAAICILSMANGLIPANAGWSHADAECIIPLTRIRAAKLKNALCNSFGFGGNDSAIIISASYADLPAINFVETYVLGQSELKSADCLADLAKYATAMERRRMSKLMKAAMLTSMKALEQARIDSPDAIIIATRYGMLEQGEKILEQISPELQGGEGGEEGFGVSPTLFMQSTHNTIAGALAIRFNCHGWNETISHGGNSFELAVEQARRLISEGRAQTVLVGAHDYLPDGFMHRMEAAGINIGERLISRSIVIGKA